MSLTKTKGAGIGPQFPDYVISPRRNLYTNLWNTLDDSMVTQIGYELSRDTHFSIRPPLSQMFAIIRSGVQQHAHSPLDQP